VDFDERHLPLQASVTAYRDGEVVACIGLPAEPFSWPDDLNNVANRLLDEQLSFW
jgi:hypothetical protein